MKYVLVFVGFIFIFFGVLEAFMVSPVDFFMWVRGRSAGLSAHQKRGWSLHNFLSSSMRWVIAGLMMLILAFAA